MRERDCFVASLLAMTGVVAGRALVRTATDLQRDLVAGGTLPFEGGHLQNSATFVVVSGVRRGRVAVVTDAVYARRKYFHPEFEFDQSVNRNAGGRWFDAYVTGDKRDFVGQSFVDNWG